MKGFYHVVDSFVRDDVPQLIAGHSRLHIIFATYNTVGGYTNGPVKTGKDGLTVEVRGGELEYSKDSNRIFHIGNPVDQMLGLCVMQDDARKAHSKVEPAVIAGEDCEVPSAIFIYGGLSAFSEAVDTAVKAKNASPSSKVFITTCDCNLMEKESRLGQFLKNKTIECVVTTGECGGRAMMRQILEGIVEAWPPAQRG